MEDATDRFRRATKSVLPEGVAEHDGTGTAPFLVREEVAVMPLGYAQGRTLVKPTLRVPRMAPYLMQFKEMVLGEETDERS